MEITITEKKAATTICLNMIVKNESKIIVRLFDSVLSIIDCYCICDTGSTDNTKEIITNYFNEKNITGKIIDRPFKNFGYNRTEALKAARGMATYILLLDADMKLIIKPDFDKNKLSVPVYSIQQGHATFKYYNTRLVSGSLDVKCVGPTHEYYDLPKGTSQARLDSLFINDIGDGGCKDNKFSRDIRLLKEGLVSEPKNGRYHFYLANSYYNTNQIDEAIQSYKKRIEINDWVEECWYSYYRLGLCYQRKGKHAEALAAWLDGYNFYPLRAENIYEMVKHYRLAAKNKLAYHFYKLGKSIPLPNSNVLFLHCDVYDYLFDYELSIFAYYLKPRPNILSNFMNIFNTPNNQDMNHLLSNYQFYCKKIRPQTQHNLASKLGDLCPGFTSSTPSILRQGENYVLNVRYVDYKLQRSGDYVYKDGSNVHTRNAYVLMDKNFNIREKKLFDSVFDYSCRIRGVEDVRIVSHGEKIHYMGTYQIPETFKLCICFGEYNKDKSRLSFNCFESPKNNDCEKNWALFSHKNDLKFIYHWNPLTIGRIIDASTSEFIEVEEQGPPIFKYFRGSTNGCYYKNEYWFITHIVHHSKPRHYYHCMVVLDGETLKYKRHSRFFTFDRECVEFCLGLIIEDERIITTHSNWDSTSKLYVYHKETLLKDLFEF